MRLRKPDFIPRFVTGEDSDLNEWLIHLHEPRFACRIRPEPFNDGTDTFHFEFDSGVFSEFEFFGPFFGPQPSDAELAAILESAADFMESFE